MERQTHSRLVARLRSGDGRALEEVYEQYRNDVVALAATILGGQDGAWDVLQDVFVSLARRAPQLSRDTNLKAYLLRAAANRSRDRLRKRPTVALEPDSAEPTCCGRHDGPWSSMVEAEQTDALWRAVVSLPEDQRTVVALHVYADMTFRQIAEAEGISENTAQSRYRYALQKLRQQCSEAEK